MIALISTFLVAAYFLGPDLFSRWILGFVVQRRNITQSKSEEITRGVMWAIIPLFAAWVLRHVGPLALPPNSRIDIQMFFSGLYSDSFFKEHQQDFFAAAGSFLWLNACILFRLYFIILLSAILLDVLIIKYGSVRHHLTSSAKKSKALARVCTPALRLLSTLVLPRISEWHVILSPFLLPSTEMNIGVDILTKTGVVYSGALEDKAIGSDGNLLTLTLREPKRFRRDQYLEDLKKLPVPEIETYWKPIPGNLFVIMGSDIANINVRHLPANLRQFSGDQDIAAALKLLRMKIRALRPMSDI